MLPRDRVGSDTSPSCLWNEPDSTSLGVLPLDPLITKEPLRTPPPIFLTSSPPELTDTAHLVVVFMVCRPYLFQGLEQGSLAPPAKVMPLSLFPGWEPGVCCLYSPEFLEKLGPKAGLGRRHLFPFSS